MVNRSFNHNSDCAANINSIAATARTEPCTRISQPLFQSQQRLLTTTARTEPCALAIETATAAGKEIISTFSVQPLSQTQNILLYSHCILHTCSHESHYSGFRSQLDRKNSALCTHADQSLFQSNSEWVPIPVPRNHKQEFRALHTCSQSRQQRMSSIPAP